MNPQDPLAQLHDIIMPPAVSAWPPAPGWWLLGLLLLAAAAYGSWRWRLYRHAGAYRREAEALLNNSWQQLQEDHNRQDYFLRLVTLLRQTALTAYPQHPVAGLHGENWLVFLDQTLASTQAPHPFSEGTGRLLLTAPYQAHCDSDPAELHELVLHWIKNHRSVNTGNSGNLPTRTQATEDAAHA